MSCSRNAGSHLAKLAKGDTLPSKNVKLILGGSLAGPLPQGQAIRRAQEAFNNADWSHRGNVPPTLPDWLRGSTKGVQDRAAQYISEVRVRCAHLGMTAAPKTLSTAYGYAAAFHQMEGDGVLVQADGTRFPPRCSRCHGRWVSKEGGSCALCSGSLRATPHLIGNVFPLELEQPVDIDPAVATIPAEVLQRRMPHPSWEIGDPGSPPVGGYSPLTVSALAHWVDYARRQTGYAGITMLRVLQQPRHRQALEALWDVTSDGEELSEKDLDSTYYKPVAELQRSELYEGGWPGLLQLQLGTVAAHDDPLQRSWLAASPLPRFTFTGVNRNLLEGLLNDLNPQVRVVAANNPYVGRVGAVSLKRVSESLRSRVPNADGGDEGATVLSLCLECGRFKLPLEECPDCPKNWDACPPLAQSFIMQTLLEGRKELLTDRPVAAAVDRALAHRVLKSMMKRHLYVK